MKQKQRGSDRHKTKVKVTLKAKEIELKGKKFDMEPILENIQEKVFTEIAWQVMDIMGVSCLPKETEVRLFDENEYKKAVKEEGFEERNGQRIGFYIYGREDVIVNFERGAKYLVEYGWEPESALIDSLIMHSAHELAHLNHHFYDPTILEKRDKLIKRIQSYDKVKEYLSLYNKGKLSSFKGYLAYIKALPLGVKFFFKFFKYGGLIEGLAQWTEFEISKRFIGHKVFEYSKVNITDEYSFGYHFVNKVSDSTDKNPVKLIMDHHPTYVEMLYPELYILRMKAALLI